MTQPAHNNTNKAHTSHALSTKTIRISNLELQQQQPSSEQFHIHSLFLFKFDPIRSLECIQLLIAITHSSVLVSESSADYFDSFKRGQSSHTSPQSFELAMECGGLGEKK